MTIDAEVVDLGGLEDVTPERREGGRLEPYLAVVVGATVMVAGGSLVATWSEFGLLAAVITGTASLTVLVHRALLARKGGWPVLDEARAFAEVQRLRRFIYRLSTLPPWRVQRSLKFFCQSGEVPVVDVEGVDVE